jgi:DNA polymerase III delta prime subunit
MSKVSSIDREFMFKMYNNFKKGQEKLSEYLSSTLSHLEDSSPESVESSVMSVPNIKTSIELSRLNQVSLEFFALYCEAYVHLQQRISMKDLAHIWAESPTVIPDVMSLLIALLQ